MRKLVYEQATGKLSFQEGGKIRLLGYGYAGKHPHINQTSAEALASRGPLPRGSYRVLPPVSHARLGPVTMFLSPFPTNNMFGRSGFYIHGDNQHANRTASSGCIVLAKPIRLAIAALGLPLHLTVQ